MKKITHLLITLTFAFACLGLWSMLHALANVSANSSRALPAFTALFVGLRTWILFLPIPVVGYCVYAVCRPKATEHSAIPFLAWTMSALCLVFFPVLFAVYLPCLVLMELVK